MKKINHLVIGCGPIGLAVMQELIRKKIPVKMASKSGKAPVPASIDVIPLDASDPLAVRKVAQNAGVVYNCTNVPYNRWEDELPKIHHGILEGVAGTEAVLVVMENLYMYGSGDGKPLTEDLPYRPISRKGKIRAQLSQALFDAHQQGKVKAVSGRASDFFGPYALQSALGERVFYPALKGKSAQVLGNPDLLHTYSYVPDIGRALVALGEREDALGQAWHLPNPETVTTRKIIQIISQKLGYPVKMQAATRGLLKLMGIFNPIVRELVEMMYEFEAPFVVDHSKFRQAFHLSATPLEQALEETIAWFRSHPKNLRHCFSSPIIISEKISGFIDNHRGESQQPDEIG